MFTNPIISIIVPIYNAEKYIDRCVRSILCQTFCKWELVLIDDGSTDMSFSLCKEYADKDERIKIFHKENGGVSSARNYGLLNSFGKWVTFVDVDDYIETDFLEKLFCVKDTVDLIVSGTYFINEKTCFMPPERLLRIADCPSFVDEQLCEIYLMTCWAKLFRKSLIDEEQVYFNTSLRIGEDTDFVLRYLKYVSNIEFIHYYGYYYNDEERGKLIKYSLNANDFNRHLSLILDGVYQLKCDYNYKFERIDRLLRCYYSRLFFVYLLRVEKYSDLYNERRTYMKGHIKYMPDSFKKKILFFCFVHIPIFSYILLLLCRKTNL